MIVEKNGTVIETHYYSPPGLKRHRFFIDSMEKRIPEPGTPSGLLIAELREKEKAASSILEKDTEDMSADEDTPPADNDEELEEEKPKRRIRSLNRVGKKIETLIYDDTAVKQGELEDEAYALLNQDGYYNEVLPIDYDEDAPTNDRKSVKVLLTYLAVLFALVGFVAWYIKFFLF